MVEGFVRAPVQPTESPAKVAAAVLNVFPEARLEPAAVGLAGPAGDLSRFAALVRDQRIPDSARGVLLRGQDGPRSRFLLSKQAAAAGRLNFAARPGPLGDLEVELRAASPQDLADYIDQVAPDTRGWTLEARGLTEKVLRTQEEEEARLDELERLAGEAGKAGEADGPPM